MNLRINKNILNEKYLQFYTDDTPTQLIFGSAGSSKSFSILTFTVLWALSGRSIIIARKINRSLRKSVFSEIVKAISRLKVTDYFEINKTELTITSTISDGCIMCVGCSDPERLKSITPIKATAFDIVIFEEATELTPEDYDLVNSRMRGISKFKKKVILLFNPISKTHWIYKRFFDSIGWNDEIDMEYRSDNLNITRCLYQDNKFLGKEEIARIEALKTVSPMFYLVYGLGRFGITYSTVFQNHIVGGFNIADINKLELHYGCDLGWSHKSAFVVSLYDKVNRRIYVIDEVGVTGKTRREFGQLVINKIKELAESKILNITRPIIYTDSAEPATIKEYQQMGLNSVQARKGPDSVKRSYDFLLSHQILVHPSCVQTIEELDTLYYEKDTHGDYNEVPVNRGDDLIAALRYSYSSIYMQQGHVLGIKAKGLY